MENSLYFYFIYVKNNYINSKKFDRYCNSRGTETFL